MGLSGFEWHREKGAGRQHPDPSQDVGMVGSDRDFLVLVQRDFA